MGNSGDRSNEHIAALKAIHQQFGDTVNVIVPMGYPAKNDAYINEVREAGRRCLAVSICRSSARSWSFMIIWRRCAAAIWAIFCLPASRIGTLCLLIQAGIPCVLNRENPFWQDMAEQHVPVLFTSDALDVSVVREAQRQLASVDKSAIAFFRPNYLTGWRRALRLAAEGQA